MSTTDSEKPVEIPKSIHTERKPFSRVGNPVGLIKDAAENAMLIKSIFITAGGGHATLTLTATQSVRIRLTENITNVHLYVPKGTSLHIGFDEYPGTVYVSGERETEPNTVQPEDWPVLAGG